MGTAHDPADSRGRSSAVTLFLAPVTFYDGVRLYADQTAARLTRQMLPLLEDLGWPDMERGEKPAPGRPHGSGPVRRR